MRHAAALLLAVATLVLAAAAAACGPRRTSIDDHPSAATRAADARAARPEADAGAPSPPIAQSPPPTTGAGAALPDDFSIALERQPCLGTCPAYTVTVDARGAVFFAGWYPEKGCASATIAADAVTDLARRVDAIGFFELKDRYTDPVTDHPWANTTVIAAGRRKVIQHYLADRLDAPDLPERQALTELEEAIDAATRSARAPLGPCAGKSPYPGVP